jgi:hypothetical protein
MGKELYAQHANGNRLNCQTTKLISVSLQIFFLRYGEQPVGGRKYLEYKRNVWE